MRLELRKYGVRELVSGGATSFESGCLAINLAELEALLGRDHRLGGLRVHLARPGENTRIIHVIDVMQPRVKAGQYESYFPGLLTETALAGDGPTHLLENVGVVLTGDLESAEEGIIELSGPGSSISHFGQMFQVVLEPAPRAAEQDPNAYAQALIEAGARTAVYLASTTLGLPPDDLEIFDWEQAAENRAGLPRVAYISYAYSHGFGREKLWYGTSTKHLVPIVIHPNEMLDGALIDNGYTRPIRNTTYDIVNNAILHDLYRRHGRELIMAGVVLTPHSLKFNFKRAFAQRAAVLCRSMLGADAVLITKDGGGQADVDVFQAITFCEELGMKTVAAVMEMCGTDGANPPIADASVYATAMISIGNGTERLTLPPVEKVIGGTALISAVGTPGGQIGISTSRLVGSIDEMGVSRTYCQAL